MYGWDTWPWVMVPWAVAGVLVLGGMVFLWLMTPNEAVAAAPRMQGEAVRAAEETTVTLLRLESLAYATQQDAIYERVAMAYADLRQSGQGDPRVCGLDVGAYRAMRDRYQALARELQTIRRGHEPLLPDKEA